MLSVHEFTVGTLREAKPLSVMLALGSEGASFLIAGSKEAPMAVFLDNGKYLFHSFSALESENWRGLIVPGIQIEVDETSIIDADLHSPMRGSLVRSESDLSMLTIGDGNYRRSGRVQLHTDLPAARGASAAFSRWQIVVGVAADKRVLRQIDVGQP